MVITRAGGASLVAGGILVAYLLVLASTGEPVGLGGPEVHGDLVLLAVGLFGLGALALVARPTRELAGRLARGSLLAAALGSLGVLLAAARAAQTGIHADADLLAVSLFMGGLLLLVAGLVLLGVALARGGGAGRICGVVILAAAAICTLATVLPEVGSTVGIFSMSLIAFAIGFGSVGVWALGSTLVGSRRPR